MEKERKPDDKDKETQVQCMNPQHLERLRNQVQNALTHERGKFECQ